MSSSTKVPDVQLDRFFTMAEARLDRWRSLLRAARSWEAAANQPRSEVEKLKEIVSAAFAELRQWEDFFAFPGPALMKTVQERIAAGDPIGTAGMVQKISAALLTHSYRTNVAEWENEEQSMNLTDRRPGTGEASKYRPYFEVLVVSPARPSTWSELARELRKLRRSEDKFVYESVFAGNFEDAVIGAILNGSIEAVIIYEGIPFASSHNNPILREFLTNHLAASGIET